VKPAPFDYYRPDTVDEALALLATHGDDAKPLAGGQSLIPAMNFRLATPAVLVDLNAIGELSYIASDKASAAALTIGAMTRHRELERSTVVANHAPLVTQTMPFVAHQAIRTRGTIGGSLAHADPAAELPAVMLALDATLSITSQSGTRTLPADEFFVGLFATAIQPGELLTKITIPPRPPRLRSAFQEFSRRHGDFALAGCAVTVSVSDDGTCDLARIALLSVGERPVLAQRAARALVGQRPTSGVIRAAAAIAASDDIDPPSDIHASSRYRRRLIEVLTRRTLGAAFAAHPETT
jgi:CO/xanthine dehydrogenase FAD-binding subunit